MDIWRNCIGTRIKEARKEAKISQRKLGMLVDMEEFCAGPRINQYEKGKHTPDFLTVNRLAKALGYPVEYFYSPTDEFAQLTLLFFRLSPSMKKKFINKLKKGQ